MVNKSVEKAIALFMLYGVPIATIFIMAEPLPFAIPVTDPVNTPKLFACGAVGIGLFAIAITYGARAMWQTSKWVVLSSIAFIIFMISAVAFSAAPLVQNLYGVYGRQTGFITYLVLTLVALSTLLLRRRQSFEYTIWALLAAGGVNVLYAGWAATVGDFINWSNPYGNILGLFGNPNFIGAFLGMFIAGATAYAFSAHKSWAYRGGTLLLVAIAFWEVLKSHAIQGLVVTGAGLAITGFYLVRSKINNAITWVYVTGVAIAGGFALAGALQKGPLAQYIYKTSVSLRGQYWKAGIETGSNHPWTGVGMDALGNWYRRDRSEYAATVLPGPNTIVNAAHNVFIDIFAYGGYPLLISYVAIIGAGVWAVIRVTLRRRAYDGIFVAMTVTWAGYVLQSIVSINQIGLAIWGWVLVGALVAYEYVTREKPEGEDASEKPANKGRVARAQQKEFIFSPQLVGGLGLVVGGLIAVPPLAADASWRAAVSSQNVQKVEAALTPSYLTPQDSMRLAQAVQIFESSKLYDQAYKYAKIGVEFNPDYFDAWKMLYAISKTPPAEKEQALAEMKRLDPRNPNVLG